MVASKRKIVKQQLSFPVFITDVDGQLTVTTGEVSGNLTDELNVREYLEMTGNTYLDFLDSLDVECDVDDEYEDEEEDVPAPVKTVQVRKTVVKK